jgi:potassium-transporting ATPase KdpC subunit
MWKQMLPGLRMTVLMTVLTGLIYPGLVTGVCQMLFPAQANGSLITRDGKIIGSALIGQNFSQPEYFQPRPSAAGSDGYDASISGGSNLGPTSQKLIDRVKAAVEKWKSDNPAHTGLLPADLATASASGLDPHVSPASASVQVPRIATARGAQPSDVEQLVEQFTEGRDLGFLGEPRVNVLLLNLALDTNYPTKR